MCELYSVSAAAYCNVCVQYSPNHCPNQVKVYYYFCCSILDYCMDTISTMQAALLPSYNHKQVKDLKCVAHSVATCLVLPHISGPPNMALQIPLFCNHTQLVVQYSAILCNLIVITSWILGSCSPTENLFLHLWEHTTLDSFGLEINAVILYT